jgi:hypothetical protein
MGKLERKLRPINPPFDTFVKGVLPPTTEADIQQLMDTTNASREEVVDQLEDVSRDVVYVNSRYQVNIRDVGSPCEGWPEFIHVSIKRRDKDRVGPERYRDFMAIKDRLIGPQHEAVEIYPARDREVDTANQYHLWVFKDPDQRMPFGFFDGRTVTGPDRASGGPGLPRQHPFDEDHHAGAET